MVSLDDIYRNADLHLIEVMHPNWQFYRNEKGFLCCRTKEQKNKAKKPNETKLTTSS